MKLEWFYHLEGDYDIHCCDVVSCSLPELITFFKANPDSKNFKKDMYIINRIIYINLKQHV